MGTVFRSLWQRTALLGHRNNFRLCELLFLAVWIGTTASCSSGASDGVEVFVPSDSNGALPSADPIQRLGRSDFRLTVAGSTERSFRFSRDGKLLAGANWTEVRIWSFPDGKLKHDLSNMIQGNSIAFTDDGNEFLVLNQRDMEIYRFDVDTGRLSGKTKLKQVVKEDGQTRYRMSDNGRWLCTTNLRGYVAVWDASTGERLWRRKRFESHYAPISREGVLTLWDSIFLECYDATSGKQLSASKHLYTLRNIVSNPEGTLVAAYSPADESIVFVDPLTNERVGGKIPCGKRDWQTWEGAISADGSRFVHWLDTSKWTFERKMAVFDVQTGDVVSSFSPPGYHSIDEPVISPDGKIVFPSGGRSVFCPIDATTGKLLYDIPDHIMAVTSLSFTPDGRTLLVGSRDKRQAWEVETGKPRTVLDVWYSDSFVAAVDDERAMVAGLRDGGAKLLDINTGQTVKMFGEESRFSSLQLAIDRKSFTAIAYDPKRRTVRRYGIETGEILAERVLPKITQRRAFDLEAYRGLALDGSRLYRFEQVSPGRTDLVLEDWTTQKVTDQLTVPAIHQFAMAAGSSDNRRLAVIGSDSWHGRQQGGFTYLRVFDVLGGRELLQLKRDREEYFAAFSAVALSPDGRIVATASHKIRIDLWNTKTGAHLQRLEATNPITVLEFSEEGKKLASGHEDGRVYIWNSESALALTAE